MPKKHVDIFSDGSSRGNPGNGGYGSIIRYIGPSGVKTEKELSCGYALTTNNRMELLGIIVALEALKEPCEVSIYSDSQYVVKAFNEKWVDSWLSRNWCSANKKPVKNVDLWKRLLEAKSKHDVSFFWVKGHAGHAENERCDELATKAADGPELKTDEGYSTGGLGLDS